MCPSGMGSDYSRWDMWTLSQHQKYDEPLKWDICNSTYILQILFYSCDTDGVIAVFYYSGSGSDVSDRVERVEWLQIVNIEIRDPNTLQKLGVHVDQLAGLRVPSHLQPDMWAVFSGVGKIGYRCQKWINADQTLIISWILLDAIINRS